MKRREVAVFFSHDGRVVSVWEGSREAARKQIARWSDVDQDPDAPYYFKMFPLRGGRQ